MSEHDKMREKVARSDAEFDGRPFDGLGRADKDRYLARAAKSLAAIGITDETGDVQWLQHLLKWREHQMEISKKFWIRAGKAALNGDTRELRSRIELAEAPLMVVVLSSPPAAAQEGDHE